ncbi:hypothetical protein LRP52_32730 [Photobacterium sp. ZSDE20]|uniref:Polymerase n=1 Tax=Photobacterium pectinilyticum TaxID=2906793 RepID=A0ABT1N8L6_9GAMM|nr:hypothetical protein [Photobacterium sp. ZSDE20]MCQ1060026.1 hypothetical protein [Photobacterium sp. ZSDE20]MDD1826951.1 hypothetical protein [Photobacterium sp. ZSDE20]
MLSVFIVMMLIYKNDRLKVDAISFLLLGIVLFLSVFTFDWSDYRYTVNFILSIVTFFIVQQMINKLDFEQVIKVIKVTIVFFIIISSIDTIYRYLFPGELRVDPDYAREVGIAFYQYKYSSIMFGDSNMVGILAVMMFGLTLYLRDVLKLNISYIYSFILAMITILSLSRASIIAMLALVFFIYFRKNSYMKIIVPLAFIVIIPSLGFMMTGGSLASKFSLWDNALTYLLERDSLILYLFGIGFGNSPVEIGRAAHNLFLIYLFEGGLITFLIMCLFYIYLLAKNFNVYYSLLPMLINSMAVAIYAGAPPIMYIIGFIFFLESKRKAFKDYYL